MKCLDLFSGTHSVANILREKGHEVITLDIDGNSDINIDILEWDYTIYPVGYFDIIWASPPCATFSILCVGNIGRRLKSINMEIYTREIMIERQENIGLPILNKTIGKVVNIPVGWWVTNEQRKYIVECIKKGW